jgi:Protein of unknown function (DUF3800)
MRAHSADGSGGLFMRVAPKPEEIAEIYIDESSQNDHRYLVIGCVINMLPEMSRLNMAIAKARLPELPNGEAKWSKVSKQKLAAYKRIVDVLFNNLEHVNFHSLAVNAALLNHQRFDAGSREIGFNKEIYQLAMKCARLYSDELFHVYPDGRVTSQKPEDLRLILNRGCSKAGDKRDWPFRRCQFRDSKNTLLLQLADIVTGAIAFKLNGHDEKKNASAAKCELSSYILKRAGIADPFKDTAIAAEFTIWHRRLR